MELSQNNPSYLTIHTESKNLNLELFFGSNDPSVSFKLNTLKNTNPNKHVVFGGVAINKENPFKDIIAAEDFSHLKNYNFDKHISELLNDPKIQQCLKFMMHNEIIVHHHELYLFNAWVGQLTQEFYKFLVKSIELKIEDQIIEWIMSNPHNNEILYSLIKWLNQNKDKDQKYQIHKFMSYADTFRGVLRSDLIKQKGADIVHAISSLYCMIQTPNEIKTFSYEEINNEFSGVELDIEIKQLLSLFLHSENAVNYIDADYSLITNCDEKDQFTTSDEGIVFFENQYPYGPFNPTNPDSSMHPPKKANVKFYTDDKYCQNMRILTNVWVNVFGKFCDAAKFTDPLAYIIRLKRYTCGGITALKNLIWLIESSSRTSHSLTYDYEPLQFRKTVNMDFEIMKESIALYRRIKLSLV